MSGISGKVPYGAGLTVNWKKNNEKRMLKSRNSRPGYPIEKKFTTKEEIDEYLSQEKITCLLCGRNYKALGNHISIHGYSVEAYKIKYGLPFMRGLTCPSHAERNSQILKERHAKGLMPMDHITKEFLQNNANKSAKLHKERYQPFRAQNDLNLLKKAVKKSSENRMAKTHCSNGHPYPEGKRRCQICNTEQTRKRIGTMDRAISKVTMIIMKCSDCGADRETSRLSKGRKIIYCKECLKKREKINQIKYNTTYREKRREQARINYHKRKEMKNVNNIE